MSLSIPHLAPLVLASLAGEVELGQDVVAIPMSHAYMYATVEVRIDGRGPYLFQVDTYASIDACIDDDLARELGLRKTGTVQNSDGHTTRTRDLVEIEQLELGGATFTDLRTLVDDYDWIRRGDGRKVDGLLGFPLFRELLVTFDYPASRLVLERGRLDPDGANTIPLEGELRVPNVRLGIGDEAVEFGLDTGSSSALLMRREDARRLPLRGELELVGRSQTVYSTMDVFAAVLVDPLDVAGLHVAPLTASFVEGRAQRLVGYGVLRSFAITFDAAEGVARFTRPPDPEGVELSKDALERWVGSYSSAGERLTIEREEDGLVLCKPNGLRAPTVALSQVELALRRSPIRVRLARGEHGRAVLWVLRHPDRPAIEFERVD